MIPYGRQTVDDDDIQAIAQATRSTWLTCGPTVGKFEQALAESAGVAHGAAVSSGTAALHCALYALGVGPGDEVLVPAMTFAATANTVVFLGARPVFADVLPDTLCLDPASANDRITERTKVIIAVDYAGQPCDYKSLQALASARSLPILADACHSLGGSYNGRPVGSLADITAVSFHPVKPITTGEGGMTLTDNPALDARVRRFRNHGMTTDFRQREAAGAWEYDIEDLGYNYRITDIQCALGLSQLGKLQGFIASRRAVAAEYDARFARIPWLKPLFVHDPSGHGRHLYVVKIDFQAIQRPRAQAFKQLREAGIGVNVHYRPVHLLAYYRDRLGCTEGMCPHAEKAYEQILSLPVFPGMTHEQIDEVVRRVLELGGS